MTKTRKNIRILDYFATVSTAESFCISMDVCKRLHVHMYAYMYAIIYVNLQKKQYRAYILPTFFHILYPVHISRLLALPTKVRTWNNAASHERSVSNFEDPTVGGSRPNASRGESHVADVDVVSTFFWGVGRVKYSQNRLRWYNLYNCFRFSFCSLGLAPRKCERPMAASDT